MSKKSRLNKNKKEISPYGKYFEFGLPLLFFVFIVIFSFVKINGEDDIFWHMQTGKYILQTMSVPSVDVFGYITQGTSWIPFEWLWDCLSYSIYSVGGFLGLYIVNSIFLLLIFTVIYNLFRKTGINLSINILLMLLIYFGAFYRIGIKPQMISYLFLVLLIKLLSDYKYFGVNVKRLYFIPLIFLVWANVHMGIFLGAALLLAFGVDLAVQKFFYHKEEKNFWIIMGICVLSALVTLINPHGINTFLYAYSHTKMKMLEEVYEWMSPFNVNYLGKLFNIIFILFLIAGIFLLVRSLRKKDFFISFSLLIFMYFAVRALRFTVDYIFLAGIFFGISYAIYFSNKKKFIPQLQYITGFLLILFIILTPGESLYKVLGFPKAFGYGLYEGTFPKKMYDFMKQNKVTEIGSNPYQTFEYGGYFIWNFPSSKNFIDSRNLNDSIWTDFYTIVNKKEGYLDLLRKFNIDYFMITRPTLTMSPDELKTTIISYLSQTPDEWKLIYWDDISELFVKNTDKFKPLIDKYEYKYLKPYNIIYKIDLLNTAFNQDSQVLQNEINRKRAEEPGGIMMNQFAKVFSRRIK